MLSGGWLREVCGAMPCACLWVTTIYLTLMLVSYHRYYIYARTQTNFSMCGKIVWPTAQTAIWESAEVIERRWAEAIVLRTTTGRLVFRNMEKSVWVRDLAWTENKTAPQRLIISSRSAPVTK